MTIRLRFVLRIALGLAGMAASAQAAAPRLLPDHDVVVVYRASAPGHSPGTYRVRYLASGQRAHVTALSGEAMGLQFLLDIPAASAELIMPQTHTIVPVPNVGDIVSRVTAARNARFTKLGTAVIAGQNCTRYLVLSPRGNGTACLTTGGVPLAASAHDSQGSLTVTALHVSDTAQPPDDFVSPAGYTTLNLPPQLLQQLLGH